MIDINALNKIDGRINGVAGLVEIYGGKEMFAVGAKKVVPMGIEPMTSRLLVWRSTD